MVVATIQVDNVPGMPHAFATGDLAADYPGVHPDAVQEVRCGEGDPLAHRALVHDSSDH